MSIRGFTLVEVLVALVVLEVGLLGVVGTLVLAATTLRQAQDLEVSVAAVERVYDSLRVAPGSGEGSTLEPLGEISWQKDAAGMVVVSFRKDASSAAWVVRGAGVPGKDP